MKKKKVAVVILIVVIIGLLCWLIWQGMLQVSPNAARLWALLATVALPGVAWAGWWFGHTEARGRLAGIDQGVDKLMGALSQAAGLRVGTARAMRRPAMYTQPPMVVLPEVEMLPAQVQIPEIVEL